MARRPASALIAMPFLGRVVPRRLAICPTPGSAPWSCPDSSRRPTRSRTWTANMPMRGAWNRMMAGMPLVTVEDRGPGHLPQHLDQAVRPRQGRGPAGVRPRLRTPRPSSITPTPPPTTGRPGWRARRRYGPPGGRTGQATPSRSITRRGRGNPPWPREAAGRRHPGRCLLPFCRPRAGRPARSGTRPSPVRPLSGTPA
jgi:hypothetical protein